MESAGELARELSRHTEAFCRAYYPNGSKTGNYWSVGDTSGVEGQSLTIRLFEAYGRKAGKWNDWATGEHGDLLDLIGLAVNATSFQDVADEARRFLRKPAVQRSTGSERRLALSRADGPKRARRLFAMAAPIAGTPARSYLRNRNIERFGDALRYHPTTYYRAARSAQPLMVPALLASITDVAGTITGVARTYLDIERRAVADLDSPKRVLGNLQGHAVRFGTPTTVLMAGEGLETMLSIGTALPRMPVAACLTATHLGLFGPPDGLTDLWIAKDNDEAGERAARILRERVEPRGLRVHELEPVLGDFNDDLEQWGAEALRLRLIADMGDQAARYAQEPAA